MAISEAEPLVPEDGEQLALLISPVEADHSRLQELFGQHRWNLHATRSLESALTFLRENAVSVVITERDLPEGDWKDVLRVIHGLRQPPLLIVISRHADNRFWAEALNRGAYDVILKPLVQAETVRVITSAWMQQLTQQIDRAHEAFNKAAAYYNEMRAKYGDMLDSLDGTFALRRAAEAERRASQKYKKAVKAYSDMVSSSRLPGPL